MLRSTKLNSFLKIEDSNKVLIIDLNNLAYRVLHIAHSSAPDDIEFNYWKYLMINSIFTSLKIFDPTKVIIAIDHPNSWRKSVYSEYKANRKENRKASAIDFDQFYKVLDAFLISFKEVFSNFYVLKVDRCEADDIIAIVAKELFSGMTKIIVSMDSDLHQLLQYKGVKVYNPIEKKFIESLNPKYMLEIKILTGDKTDNIKAIRPRLGKGTAKKIMDNGLDIFLQNEENKSLYTRNKQLIDLDFIPLELINNIKNEINSYQISKLNEMKLFNWLMKNKIQKFAEELTLYTQFLRRIC